MSVQLTDEQRDALLRSTGPIEIHDSVMQQHYMLLPKTEYLRLVDDQLRREIQLGIDQADRGELEEWDVEAVIAEANRRYTAKHGK